MAVTFQEQPLGRVKLAIPRWRLLLGRPAGLAAVTLAIGLLAFAYLRSRAGIDGWVLGTLVAGAIAAGLGIRSMAEAAGTGELLVFNDRLVIDNRYVFKEPVSIPRGLIRVIVVDDSPGDRRFPIRSEPVDLAALFDDPVPPGDLFEQDEMPFDGRIFDVPGHLYTPEHALLLPSVAEPNDVPNVAVLFREPITMRALRLQPGYVIRGRFPSPDEAEWGFWARARQPEMARHTLSLVAPLRELETEDVLPLLPRLEVVPQARKRQIFLVAVFIGLAAIRAIGEFWPEQDAAPASTACDDVKALVEQADVARPVHRPKAGKDVLPEITDIEPPSGYTQVEEGFGDLVEVASARRGFEDEWERRFRGLGFKSAFGRVWTSGDDGMFVEVIEFGRRAAALDYVYWETSYGCSQKEIFSIPELQGSIGTVHDLDARRVAHVHFVRGPRSFYVTLWNPIGQDPPRSLVAEMALQVEARAEGEL